MAKHWRNISEQVFSTGVFRLSNFPFFNQTPDGPISCRVVTELERQEALSLVLMNRHRPADWRAIDAFVMSASERKLAVNEIFAAFIGKRMVWAFLPLLSAGRTALIFGCADTPPAQLAPAVEKLVNVVCDYYSTRQIDLIQMLLEPPAGEMSQILANCRFKQIAELVYLQKSYRRFVDQPFLPTGIQQVTYSKQTHSLFAQAIIRSYEDSLDCPALNGMRDIENVLAGHKATGVFDPNLWFTLVENDEPIGTLLLSPTHDHQTLELVYIGIAKVARGRGLGDYFLQLAAFIATQQHIPTLALAVDSINQPALRMYFRHGLTRVTSKLALLRDLRVK